MSTPSTEPVIVGREIGPSFYQPQRDLLCVERITHGGNIPVRIGREIDSSGQWEQTGYVVLTPEEARILAARLLEVAS